MFHEIELAIMSCLISFDQHQYINLIFLILTLTLFCCCCCCSMLQLNANIYSTVQIKLNQIKLIIHSTSHHIQNADLI